MYKGLIDGDMAVHKCGYASERVVEGEVVSVEPKIAYVYHKVNKFISYILSEAHISSYQLFLGSEDKSNFRYDIAKTEKYKANRKEKKRPEFEKEIREFLIKRWGAIVVYGAEVDDVLGIEQDKTSAHTTIICTADKDCDQVPGMHFDPEVGSSKMVNGSRMPMKLYKPSPIYIVRDPGYIQLYRKDNKKCKLIGAGYLWFCAQLIMGDSVDGVPSMKKGFGDAATYNVLKNCKTEEEGVKTVWECYKKNLGSKFNENEIRDRLYEQAQLVWIKRSVNDVIFPERWVA